MSSTRRTTLLNVLGLLLALYGFFLSLELMSGAFKLFGRGLAQQLIATTSNPLVGLFIGILATSLVQSSSTVTSMIVGLVAAGALTIHTAIPMVMGANIGTSVTNTIVSLGSITRGAEFRRSLAGATVHDFFNLLSVAVLFPLELMTGYLAWISTKLGGMLQGVGGVNLLSPVKAIIKPAEKWVMEFLGHNATLALILALLLLFYALKYLSAILRSLFLARSEGFLQRFLFSSDIVAMGFGVILTIMVQSSSITTSVVIPLVGAGILTLEQIYPYTLGANIGTTITAILAALVTQSPSAVIVAFAHLMFNLTGIVLLYPIRVIRRIPIHMARGLATLTSRSRVYPFAYVGTVFFALPLILISFVGEPVEIKTIQVAGSESLLPLVEALEEDYGKTHVLVDLEAQGGGSSLGLDKLLAGEVDLAAISVEPRTLQQWPESGLQAHPVARDGLVFAVHQDNPVTEVSLEQLRQVFTGQILSWDVLGGQDTAMILLVRPPDSGSARFLEQSLLQGQKVGGFSLQTLEPAQGFALLERNPQAVAYASSAQPLFDKMRLLNLEGKTPSMENIAQQAYPLTRKLYLVARDDAPEHVLQFLAYLKGKKAQTITEAQGFAPPEASADSLENVSQ